MLALRVEYLTGRVVATRYNDRDAAEWPPHPARLFSALVACWAEQLPLDEPERQALTWLEGLSPPHIACSSCHERRVVTHYVPVNDPSLLSSKLGRYQAERDALQQQLAAGGSVQAATKQAERETQRLRADLLKAQARYARELGTTTAVAPSTSESLKVARSLLPETRLRQPRSFPCVIPHDPVVHFVWPDSDAREHRAALAGLASRLVNLGHSSSLVHARWVDAAPAPRWVPSATGSDILRVVAAGQLARLQEDHLRHQGSEPRVLPFLPQRYARGAESWATPVHEGVFTRRDWIVLRRAGGLPLSSVHAAAIARAVRGALMRHADQPVAELLSGHQPNGQPARAAHLAIVPLPHVGHRHADGRVMGVALVLPRELDSQVRQAVVRALAHWEQAARQEHGSPDDDAPLLTLGLGRGVTLELERVVWGEPASAALRVATWCAPALEWASVTPVALDRNPGQLHSREAAKARAAADAAAAVIGTACQRAGLPQPVQVDVMAASPWAGGQAAAAFPPYPAAAGRPRKVKVHARLVFAEPVFGPLLIGAGRFQGLGLFRPVPERDA